MLIALLLVPPIAPRAGAPGASAPGPRPANHLVRPAGAVVSRALTPTYNGSCAITASTAWLNCTGMDFTAGDTFIAVVFDYLSQAPNVTSSSFGSSAASTFLTMSAGPGTPGVSSSPAMYGLRANATSSSSPGWVNVSIGVSGWVIVEWWTFASTIAPIPRLVGAGSQGSSTQPYDPLTGTATGDTLVSVFASTRPTGSWTIHGSWNFTGNPANAPGGATAGINSAESWAFVAGGFAVPDPWLDLQYSTSWSALSFTVSASTPSNVPPAPTGLTVTGSTRSSVDLTWQNPAGPLTNVTVVTGPGSCPLAAGTTSVSVGVVTSYQVGGLGASADYCFAVQAWNANGSSVRSIAVHAVTPPILGYEERNYGLPGFNPLQGYFLTGTVDTQIPTLASHPGIPYGIYYVDNNSELAYLALPNDTLEEIAPVIPLYQLFGYGTPLGGMLDNEFFLSADRALFFGTTAPFGTTYSLELVNLTSGAVTMWNTSASIDAFNQQPEYVGNDTVIVVSSNCTILAYNLADHRSWLAGTVGANFGPGSTCFEANNLYWFPQKSQLINVEAHGDRGDHVEQLDGTIDSAGRIQFTPRTTIAVDSGVVFNWVNGLAYNATSDAIAFSAGYWVGGTVYTYRLNYGANGALTTSGELRYTVYDSTGGPSGRLLQIQRYIGTTDYFLGESDGPGTWTNGTQFLFDPWNGSVLRTNRSLDGSSPCGNSCFEGQYAADSNYFLDFTATLALNGPTSPMYIVVYAHRGALVPPASLAVTFTETGLPSGTTWSVNVNGTVRSAASSVITFALLPGGYPFLVGPVAGFVPSPRSGTAQVGPSPSTVAIVFAPFRANLTFRERGLPAGTAWSVVLNGSTSRSTNSSIVLALANGSYDFAVAAGGFVASPANGTVVVAGAPVERNISFAPEPPAQFYVTILELGLPAGTNWSVTVNGTVRSTVGPLLQFQEPNGSYPYSVANAAGYAAAPASGTLTVAGAPVDLLVNFTVPASSTGLFGLPDDAGLYVVIVLVVAAAAVATGLLYWRRRRALPPPEPIEPPPE